MKGKKTKNTAAGREIIAALTDLAETLEAGTPLEDKYVVHTVTVPEPGRYGAAEVKALRAKLNVSQAVFAQLVGASRILVQKWEGGDRNPDGMARRLFDGINHDPQGWLTSLARLAPSKTFTPGLKEASMATAGKSRQRRGSTV